jgi:hypothetical protein
MFFQQLLKISGRISLTGIYASLLLLGSFCLTETAHAHCDKCSSSSKEISTQKLARSLVKHYWNEVKEENVKGYSRLIALGFQGLNINGIYNRNDQISGLQGLTVTKFRIEDLVAARYKNTLVISYEFLAEGTGIVSGPSIDIWFENDGEWKLISHSYVPFQ